MRKIIFIAAVAVSVSACNGQAYDRYRASQNRLKTEFANPRILVDQKTNKQYIVEWMSSENFRVSEVE